MLAPNNESVLDFLSAAADTQGNTGGKVAKVHQPVSYRPPSSPSHRPPSSPKAREIKNRHEARPPEKPRKITPAPVRTEELIDRAPRYIAHWKIAIVYDDGKGDKEIYYGRTYEVSMTGASILSDHNVFFEGDIYILLALPWFRGKQKERIFRIRGRMVYTILSSEGNQFRTGLQFLSCEKGEAQYIEMALQGRRRVVKSDKYFTV